MAKQMTLAEYLVSKVGLRKATTVASFVVAWGIYTERAKPPHTMKDYCEFWGQSLAYGYKERDVFRICFPHDDFPDRQWAHVREVYRSVSERGERERAAARALSVQGSWS